MRKKTVKRIGVGVLVTFMSLGTLACSKTSNVEENTQPGQEIEQTEEDKQKDENLFNDKINVDMVKKASTTDESAFEYEEIDGGISITNYVGNSEIVVIPEKIGDKDVIMVGEASFANNTKIKGMMLPDTLQVIEKDAFGNCHALQVVVCGENLQTIGEYAFNYCDSLHSVQLSSKVESLKRSSFGLATALKEIYIPTSVTNIDRAFAGLNNTLTIITEAGSVAEQYAKDEGIPCKIK